MLILSGDVDGDDLPDIVVINSGAAEAGPATLGVLLNSTPVVACPWDCADGDGTVGIVDFLGLLAQWGQVGAPCDIDGGGVGITDFLALLANWGPCP